MRIVKDVLSKDYICLTNDKTLLNLFENIYVTDLLSQAIKSAERYSILITLISHETTVGVAIMLDLPAIIISEDKNVSDMMIRKCNEENICLIKTPLKSYEVVLDLYQRGVYEISL
ncbi:MAG: hypothetical protein A2Y45_03660 [Tenericutes bacterium GWC2_34_14]|nr:MAG: hypothetical protein US32_C0002G0015 [candidate division TM6 bacterium GW2011_GWA2_36_9]OHE29231.1 MAG: hypothetical protein A2Y45_03660 [Tenericutes bacterium GWC2_34_14]OHE34314.1 MAG: hypothetical protein A2012_09250 [Tenericutes bacterium GWE2_34_108]OHE35666.1 MAG: hypothetical protein A2Y46_06015 [Tenericutes bacterium GWF1_35_14]OHE38881.1 MAG: hypothetical protein A2Y44_00450 [Tenericutes bacterium GWF2_35_184]OHE43913.1 MAG: hypothetical protein A2221_10345 [Tenericutes bacter